MTIICYKDPATQENKWESEPGSVEVALKNFRRKHPGVEPEYQFLPRDNAMPNDDAPWRRGFLLHHGEYGFTMQDLDTEMRLENGHKAFMKGVDPNKRTNVVVVWDCAKQNYVHMSAGQARAAINRCKIACGP